MKIKAWALTLIIVGSLLVGAVGGALATGGVLIAGRAMQAMRSTGMQRFGNGWQWGNPGSGQQFPGGNGWQNPGSTSPDTQTPNTDNGNNQQAPDTQAQLPEGFNAGVSIAAVYGSMTNRTEGQVTADAEKNNTSVWGLAQQEGKLDQLKANVLTEVTKSLDNMISQNTITAAQKELYLTKVKGMLESISTELGIATGNNGATLPANFNAGVSIAKVYGGLTNRTEAQVNDEVAKNNTSVWGLAQKEGKLDQLKANVLTEVTKSLDNMVSDKKITTAQKDLYLQYVNKLLASIGNEQAAGFPGGGGFGNGNALPDSGTGNNKTVD